MSSGDPKDAELAEEPTAEVGATPVGVRPIPKQLHTDRSFLKPVRRPLTERELATVAAQNFLLGDIDRLQSELEQARQGRDDCLASANNWQEKYYIQNADLQVLQERTRKSSALDLLYNVSIIGGSALAGLSPGMLTTSGPAADQMHTHGWIILAFAAFLILGSVGARILQADWSRLGTGNK